MPAGVPLSWGLGLNGELGVLITNQPISGERESPRLHSAGSFAWEQGRLPGEQLLRQKLRTGGKAWRKGMQEGWGSASSKARRRGQRGLFEAQSGHRDLKAC